MAENKSIFSLRGCKINLEQSYSEVNWLEPLERRGLYWTTISTAIRTAPHYICLLSPRAYILREKSTRFCTSNTHIPRSVQCFGYCHHSSLICDIDVSTTLMILPLLPENVFVEFHQLTSKNDLIGKQTGIRSVFRVRGSILREFESYRRL